MRGVQGVQAIEGDTAAAQRADLPAAPRGPAPYTPRAAPCTPAHPRAAPHLAHHAPPLIPVPPRAAPCRLTSRIGHRARVHLLGALARGVTGAAAALAAAALAAAAAGRTTARTAATSLRLHLHLDRARPRRRLLRAHPAHQHSQPEQPPLVHARRRLRHALQTRWAERRARRRQQPHRSHVAVAARRGCRRTRVRAGLVHRELGGAQAVRVARRRVRRAGGEQQPHAPRAARVCRQVEGPVTLGGLQRLQQLAQPAGTVRCLRAREHEAKRRRVAALCREQQRTPALRSSRPRVGFGL